MRHVATRGDDDIRRVYKTLLRLYPWDYRALFAGEMLNTFEASADRYRAQGWFAFVRFAIGEMAGLVMGAGAEWVAKLTTDRSIRGRRLPDLRMTRPPGVPRELWFAGLCMNLRQNSMPEEVMEAHARITLLVNRTVHAIANHDFPGARSASLEERKERENLRLLREKYQITE